MEYIIVLAKVEPKNGCSDSIIELSQDLIEETLKEEGNIDYQLVSSIDDDSLTFIEKWKSLEDLKKHMSSSHFQLFGSESEEFVEKMDIEVISAENIDL